MANIPLVYNISLSDVQTFKDFGTFQNNFDDFGNDQLVYNISQSFEGKFNYIKLPIKSFLYNLQVSYRPDGTQRQILKIRPGYIPQEEIPKYIIPKNRVIYSIKN